MSSRPDKVIDFRDFGERPARGLDTALYIGSKPAAKANGTLRELGVKYILNCTPTRNLDPEAGCPNFFEKDSYFTYKRIPIFDNRGEDILQYMEGAVAFIEQGKHYGSVIVHCNKGVSRSASFVLGYLMKTGGLRLDAALQLLKSKRPSIAPNDSFVTQLLAYDTQLEQQRAQGAKKPGVAAVSSPYARNTAAAASPSRKTVAGSARAPSPSRGPISPLLPPSASSSPSSSPPRPREGPQPQGQSIGPSMPRAPSPARGQEEKSGDRGERRIGPALPPAAVNVQAGDGASGGDRASIGPLPPPSMGKRPIGPSRPPPLGGDESLQPKSKKSKV